MNLLDLPGREFLVYYFFIAIAAFIVAAVLRWSLRQPADEAAMPPPLSSCDVAYLAGGKKLAVNAAVARLVHEKGLTLDYLTERLKVQGQLPRDAQPLEKAVYCEVAEDSDRKLAELYDATADQADAIQTRLEELGLLVSSGQAAVVRIWPMLVIAAVLALGIAKLAVGVQRDKPVGFLIALMVPLGSTRSNARTTSACLMTSLNSLPPTRPRLACCR